MKRTPIDRSFASLEGLTKPSTSIDMELFHKEGKLVIPKIVDLFPVKMSLLQNSNAYAIEDHNGDLHIWSMMSVHRFGWTDFDFPEIDSETLEKLNKPNRFIYCE